MKGVTVCPLIYRSRWTDCYRHLFEGLESRLGFQTQYTNDCFIPKDTDVVFTFAVPQHDRANLMVDYLSKVPKNVFMIGYMRDLHDYDRQEVKDSMRKMFDRYDLILSPGKQMFMELYPEYADKMEVFPDFFSPYDRYASLPINSRFNMCLLSGAYNPVVYTIRDYIIKNGDGRRITHIPPPYFGEHDFIGDRYAKLLNQFQCCVTESGIFTYVVTKCFEIPAAGSLLLTNTIDDMDEFGFTPNVHYVPINKDNVLDIIYNVLDNPDRYEMIKKEGRKMVLENHSIDTRLDFLTCVLGEYDHIISEGKNE